MAQPIKRSSTAVVAETAESGLANGILGGLAGFFGGGLIGAVAGAVIVGGALALGGFALGAVAAILPSATFTLASAGTFAAAVGTIGAYVGGAAGGIGGAYYGTMAGGVVGAVRGVINKGENINADERMAANVGRSKELQNMQQMAAVRDQAAQQYTQMGYAQGLQDGQAAVVAQLQQAALAQQAQEAQQPKTSFVEKEAERRGKAPEELAAATHAEHAKTSKEAAHHAAHIG